MWTVMSFIPPRITLHKLALEGKRLRNAYTNLFGKSGKLEDYITMNLTESGFML
jgi:hypothetical protein